MKTHIMRLAKAFFYIITMIAVIPAVAGDAKESGNVDKTGEKRGLVISEKSKQDATQVPLRIMTFNLQYGKQASLEEIAEYIKEQNPDFVALQELDINTHRSTAPHQNGKNFINTLGYLTGMFSQYGKTLDFSGGYYGIGLLSKYPIIESSVVLLPNPQQTEQRVLLKSVCEITPKDTVEFVATHIDFKNMAIRECQINFLSQNLSKSKYPVIVGGDFNSEPDSPEIVNGMTDWIMLSDNKYTFPSDTPKVKIDYLYGYPKDRWTLVKSVVGKKILSDHLPIISEVSLKK